MSLPPTKIGPYEIIGKQGTPGLSEVFLAQHHSTGMKVVIKRLREQDLGNDELLLRFKREAKLLGKLENAPIVPIFEFNDLGERPYIVMRYMAGGTLREKIDGDPQSLEQIISTIERITKALDIAHRKKVIHRDIKPSNILFDENGDAFLSDFGLSKQLDTSLPLTHTDSTIGTPLYMSPEQIVSPRHIDSRSDIYSLTVILYEMLTGKHPFADDVDLSNIHSIMNAIVNHDIPQLTSGDLKKLGLPPECNHILLKGMAKDPGKRYEKASDLARDVARLKNSAIAVSYKRVPDPASLHQVAIYWFAGLLDNRLYRGVANENQFKRLLPWSGFSILFFGSLMAFMLNILLDVNFSHFTSPFSTKTPTVPIISTLTSAHTLPPTPTPTVNSLLAVAKDDLICYLDGTSTISVNLPQFLTMMATGRDEDWDWVLVSTEEFKPCWVELSLLEIKGDLSGLPVVTTSHPPVKVPTITPTPVILTTQTDQSIDPINILWKVKSYACNDNGTVYNVAIDIDVSGGIPPYKFDSEIPINAIPNQTISVNVKSDTLDGEPSGKITFTVPRAADFICNRTGENPGPQPGPILTDTPKPPPTATLKPPSTITPKPPPTDTPSGPRECNDGIDNDGDGKIDYPADDGCKSQGDGSES